MRYSKNIDEILTQDIQNLLLMKNIAVIGCGGQGGYTLDFLVRLGVKSIIFWDGDNFSESNLNRQLGCTEKTIGKNKAEVMFQYLKEINSSIDLQYRNWYFGYHQNDLQEILSVDFIFNAADYYINVIQMRKLLEHALSNNIPIIDYPSIFEGGYIYIDTKKSLNHFHQQTQHGLFQQITTDSAIISGCTAYKCAYLAAEAVNQMILYFSQHEKTLINSGIIINMNEHTYYKFI